MDKMLRRLLHPNMGIYFMLLLCFAGASALFQQYMLAGIELAIWMIVVALYLVQRAGRRKKLKTFVQKVLDEIVGGVRFNGKNID